MNIILSHSQGPDFKVWHSLPWMYRLVDAKVCTLTITKLKIRNAVRGFWEHKQLHSNTKTEMNATNIWSFQTIWEWKFTMLWKAIHIQHCFSHTQNTWVWGSKKEVSLLYVLYLMTHSQIFCTPSLQLQMALDFVLIARKECSNHCPLQLIYWLGSDINHSVLMWLN